MTCPSCSSQVLAGSRFCSACGSAVDIGTSPTLSQAPGSTPKTPRSGGSVTRTSPSSSSTALGGARFAPGTTLADRYRIVALLGRGGMGEVYRAEDLKLSQQVALKFLPEAVAQDGAALARFHREVRVARQVSHGNVCRVFDIGEADGLPFISMEFVDGEDLGSLLRRIGRLPADKALEIARQMCAGLAAAHENGVLHCDLKPANVMIDGRGKTRITDFGLAGLIGDFGDGEVHGGTPAYMAPEQLAGGAATVRSDIFALGLVLYELFTGKRAFEAASLAELRRLHEHSTPASPSTLVRDLDPVAERIILRCLDKNPQARPATALQVAAALPGGDPLAAALAAGETPSPEMVAASGIVEGMRPWIAWSCLAGLAVGVVACVLLSAQTKIYRRVPLEKPPEALTERARDILQNLGYTTPPADTAVGIFEDPIMLRYIAEHDESKTRFDHLDTGVMTFWFRGSPRPLLPQLFQSNSPLNGAVWTDDPPLDASGMTLVQLNPRGRLTQLVVVPPQLEKAGQAAPQPDWTLLFTAAGLDPTQWKPDAPTWTPPVYSDARAAWTGALPERPAVPVRIEAAAYRGRPVYFTLIGPWTRPERTEPYQPTTTERIATIIGFSLFWSLVIGSLALARANLRMGRGDRRGAFRLAACALVAWTVSWLAGAQHVLTLALAPALLFVSIGTMFCCFAWVLYIALEPYVRRRWPHAMVSWSRLVAGAYRDPLVGRDILLGCLLAALSVVLARIGWFVPLWLGRPPDAPYVGPAMELLGARALISSLAARVLISITAGMGTLFLLFVLRALLRKQWLAVLVFVMISSLTNPFSQASYVLFVRDLILAGLTVYVIIRFGILAYISFIFFSVFLGSFPLTTDSSVWYSNISLAGMVSMAAIAFYSFFISLGGQPMFGTRALEE